MILPLLVVDEQKSSVYGIQLDREDTVKTEQAVAECLAVLCESTACRSMNVRSASIHSCMVRICEQQFSEIPAVRESRCYCSCARMVYGMPGRKSWNSYGDNMRQLYAE
jgi:hypothetical protein